MLLPDDFWVKRQKYEGQLSIDRIIIFPHAHVDLVYQSKLSPAPHHLTSNADPWSEARHRLAHFPDQLGGKHEQITPIISHISHSPGLQTPSVGNQVRRFIASDNIGSWGYQGRCRQQTLATLNIVSVWLIKSFTLKLSGKWVVPSRAGLRERG